MKSIVVAVLLAGSSSVWAGPLLSKVSGTGRNVQPDYANSQSCELYRDKMVIKFTYGLASGQSTTITREQPLTLDSNFQTLLTDSAKGDLQTWENDSCGFPRTVITTGEGVVLTDSGGCGQPRVFRNGGAARALLDLLNVYCSKTF